jgi:hypothetical protein
MSKIAKVDKAAKTGVEKLVTALQLATAALALFNAGMQTRKSIREAVAQEMAERGDGFTEDEIESALGRAIKNFSVKEKN